MLGVDQSAIRALGRNNSSSQGLDCPSCDCRETPSARTPAPEGFRCTCRSTCPVEKNATLPPPWVSCSPICRGSRPAFFVCFWIPFSNHDPCTIRRDPTRLCGLWGLRRCHNQPRPSRTRGTVRPMMPVSATARCCTVEQRFGDLTSGVRWPLPSGALMVFARFLLANLILRCPWRAPQMRSTANSRSEQTPTAATSQQERTNSQSRVRCETTLTLLLARNVFPFDRQIEAFSFRDQW